MTYSYVLSGLRIDMHQALELFKGARAMRDSVTYMAIVEEGVERGFEKRFEIGFEKGFEIGFEIGIEKGIEKGRIAEACKLILRFGRKSLGPPSKKTVASLDGVTDIDRLERMLECHAEVTSWNELLAVK